MEQYEENILENEINLVLASRGLRFANYLVDMLSYYLLSFLVGIIIGLTAGPEVFNSFEKTPGSGLIDIFLSLVFYAVYLSTMEAIFKGKTLGKMVTGTRAVNQDGTNITTATAFKRGFSRATPFCVFSALGDPPYPWQDTWTDTYVIVEKDSIRGIV